ncbi:MAG: hypothetical protein Q7N87_04375 [Candidatus Uhrbacteria bacterium]|nr:hypothetical protein [Candidatus Uhrbacteria bacterium]
MNIKKCVSLFGLLVLFGAGCASSTSETAPSPAVPASSNATSPTPVAATSSTFIVNETWGTYTNKALSFQFRYPTKEVYSPQWQVKFYKENDPLIKDGCFRNWGIEDGPPSERVAEFCHSIFGDGVPGSLYIMNYYTTKKGTTHIVISFTKHVFSASALDCKFSDEFSHSLISPGCLPFKPNEYRELLEIIVSTFSWTGADR